MANAFIKATRVVTTALALLEREIVLPGLVWRDAGGDFAGAANDTISIRVPAYMKARTRTLRAGTPVTVDELDETKVDVTLNTDVYKAIGISDEELSLDIVDFGVQVMQPVVRSVARGVEDAVAAEMSAADYAVEITMDVTQPQVAIIGARRALNDANVPQGQRALAVGSAVEEAILNSPLFIRYDQSGGTTARTDAMIGKIAGFPVVVSNGLPSGEAYAFHQTAYVLSTRAPVLPQGASWGASESFAGFSMRVLRDYDFVNTRDRLLADLFAGTNVVKDRGLIDSDGKFQPTVDGDDDPILVRAVKISL